MRPPASPRFSRRSFLAAGALLGGAAAGLWSCREEPKTASRADATQAAMSDPGSAHPLAQTAPSSAPTVAAGPAPDLGSEVFPDPSGSPIARPSDAPVIVVPRTDWTAARPNLADIAVMNGIDKITVHHTAMPMKTDAWKPTAGELENIRGFHAGSQPTDRNWADIAYHFVVDRAGRVWQARPLAYQGAHVHGHNEHNLGIVLLGTFEVQSPAAAQLWSLAGFVGFLQNLYHVPLDRVFTHGELGMTQCPGKNLQAYMDRTRRAWAAAAGTEWVSIRHTAAISTTEQPDGR
jgi:hypothetical protein